MEENKKPWESKTLWISLIMALAPLCPPVQAVIVANPELVAIAVSAVFAGLRLMSSKPIGVK